MKQHTKFIAAKPKHGPAGTALFQYIAKFAQALVPFVVAQGVVQLFKIIQVDHDKSITGAVLVFFHPLKSTAQCGAVINAGQLVSQQPQLHLVALNLFLNAGGYFSALKPNYNNAGHVKSKQHTERNQKIGTCKPVYKRVAHFRVPANVQIRHNF
ncbi:hypothetical protein SDC9_94278 [bioreactor metagenome]|uniref:Uncharacterized protein n=1 Tax=bioreactor metagenome TaxID=1076179 RepID=A0A645A3B2_9ZZZZ